MVPCGAKDQAIPCNKCEDKARPGYHGHLEKSLIPHQISSEDRKYVSTQAEINVIPFNKLFLNNCLRKLELGGKREREFDIFYC